MTAYEIDPHGVLTDGCRVRTATEGGIEGTWRRNFDGRYAGRIYVDGINQVFVPRGLEQHLIVLREVVDNPPTEPGKYEVTWPSGDVDEFNPWTLTDDGRWLDSKGADGTRHPHLRRASFRRLPDRPTEPGWYLVWQREEARPGLWELSGETWRYANSGRVVGFDMDRAERFHRVSDEPWNPTACEQHGHAPNMGRCLRCGLDR